MDVISLVGARPNFVKIAPIIAVMSEYPHRFGQKLVHSGQHYDYSMSQVFFEDLNLPSPDIYLGVGSGTHAEQTGMVLIEFEKVLLREGADLVLIVGDVNSTLAGALAAAKLHIPVAHVEAGLRSFDAYMPEEINRLLTDDISDYLFAPSQDACDNLRKEGIAEDKLFLVGNVMVDSLLRSKKKADESGILSRLSVLKGGYSVLTLHRPENVDSKEKLQEIIAAVMEVSRRIDVVFPAHPRTQKKLKEFGLFDALSKTSHRILMIDPLGYLDFIKLEMDAKFVITDSGGVQEETTVFGVPCLTVRNNTERPVTVSQGTNILVGEDGRKMVEEAFNILDGGSKKGRCPELWDGLASQRIVNVLLQHG